MNINDIMANILAGWAEQQGGDPKAEQAPAKKGAQQPAAQKTMYVPGMGTTPLVQQAIDRSRSNIPVLPEMVTEAIKSGLPAIQRKLTDSQIEALAPSVAARANAARAFADTQNAERLDRVSKMLNALESVVYHPIQSPVKGIESGVREMSGSLRQYFNSPNTMGQMLAIGRGAMGAAEAAGSAAAPITPGYSLGMSYLTDAANAVSDGNATGAAAIAGMLPMLFSLRKPASAIKAADSGLSKFGRLYEILTSGRKIKNAEILADESAFANAMNWAASRVRSGQPGAAAEYVGAQQKYWDAVEKLPEAYIRNMSASMNLPAESVMKSTFRHGSTSDNVLQPLNPAVYGKSADEAASIIHKAIAEKPFEIAARINLDEAGRVVNAQPSTTLNPVKVGTKQSRRPPDPHSVDFITKGLVPVSDAPSIHNHPVSMSSTASVEMPTRGVLTGDIGMYNQHSTSRPFISGDYISSREGLLRYDANKVRQYADDAVSGAVPVGPDEARSYIAPQQIPDSALPLPDLPEGRVPAFNDGPARLQFFAYPNGNPAVTASYEFAPSVLDHKNFPKLLEALSRRHSSVDASIALPNSAAQEVPQAAQRIQALIDAGLLRFGGVPNVDELLRGVNTPEWIKRLSRVRGGSGIPLVEMKTPRNGEAFPSERMA